MFGIFRDPTAVSVETVKEALDTKVDVTVIDVREPDEYAAGHIKGSVLMPLSDMQRVSSITDKDKTMYLYCRSGARSGRAVGILRSLGFTNVHNMSGGLLAWTHKGYALEK